MRTHPHGTVYISGVLWAALLLGLLSCVVHRQPEEVPSSNETSACTSLGGLNLTPDALPGRLELSDTHYDGETLSGRLLVTPVTHSLHLDRRLISYSHINVSAVSDCGTGELVPFVIWDAVPPQAREEDLLTLECGYWYGAPMNYKLFVERARGPGPECIDVQLALLSFDGKPVASHSVRATRAYLTPADGGTTEEPSLAPDAGQR